MEKENRLRKLEGQWVQEKLDLLAPGSVPDPRKARARLEIEIAKKEQTMGQKIFGPKYRPAWIALVVMAALAISLSFPQVRVIANSFLGLFRVERIEAVQVGISLDNLPAEMETQFKALDNLIGDQLQIEEVAEPIELASLAEAESLAGFTVRAPADLGTNSRILYHEPASVKLVIDRARWQALLEGIGIEDFELPESADGAEIEFNIPEAVMIGVGDCKTDEINEAKVRESGLQNCTIFMQSGIPSIEAPPGIDINAAGQALLQMMGMTKAEAEDFSSRVNWATTLVVPVPSDINYRNVRIEGADGILLEDLYANGQPVYTLLWIKDGRFYALTGAGELSEALRFVDSLQ